jgi:feruloyl esterase
MRKDTHILRFACVVAVSSLAVAGPCRAVTCQDMLNLKLPDTEIKSAEHVAAGEFLAPDKAKRPDLPAFCRVIASVKAAPDSDIGVEIWLPENQWKGVFHGTGNGGFAGSLSAGYAGMEAGLRRGYASATTDTGTAPATALNGDPLIGHSQKWKDWGMLSTHVMTVTGKAIAKAFYGEQARHSYYTGCSTGGQQGLIEAQYYPEDFDGILVGAPVINRTWGHAVAVWDFLAANQFPGHKLSEAKLALLNKAAVSACGDKSNGLSTDPFISDPQVCKFDPATLACSGTASDSCLTPGELKTAQAFYSGPLNRAGRPTYYGWLPGSEAPGRVGWSFLESPPNDEPAFGGLFKWVFGAGWDWRGFDFDRDMPKVDAMLGPSVNGVMRGDMSQFRARGGKLIIFHGWADTLVAPGQTIDFYHRLGEKFGGSVKQQDFVRLFMAPGVMHCGGGPGPNAFDAANGGARRPPSETARDDLFAAMTHWVEEGVAPTQVIATKYVEDTPARGIAMQRPLCAYPQKAWYQGSGDSNDAASFICAVNKAPRK